MGLESVEIIMAWEESFGITLSEAANMFTSRNAFDVIHAKRHTAEPSLPEDSGWLALRACRRLKRSCIGRRVR